MPAPLAKPWIAMPVTALLFALPEKVRPLAPAEVTAAPSIPTRCSASVPSTRVPSKESVCVIAGRTAASVIVSTT